MGRGINLGNALEAPVEGEWGVTLQADYFRLIKEAGFNSVRIPVRWSAHAQLDSPYTIETAFLNRVNWATIHALSNGLMVTINIHHYQEINEYPAQHKARMLGLWRQIAFHFQAYSDSLLFEVLNEPHDALTPTLWNEYLADAITVIRETNPNRTLVIGTANWGGIGSLADLEIPAEEYNVIVTFHYYDPFQFTHQGAEWVEGSSAWLGTTWDGTIAEMAAIRSDFEEVRDWGIAHQHPVFLGEFGAYSKADIDSRARWTAFVAREAEFMGMSWTYWEFCSGFGIYDAASGTWNTALRDALLID